MLEHLLSRQKLIDYFNTQFENKITTITDDVYSKNSEIQLINPYSSHNIYLSLQAKKSQTGETVKQFRDKLRYSRAKGDIFIPIWLTGKAGKYGEKLTNDFIYPFPGSKQSIRNVHESTDDLSLIHI